MPARNRWMLLPLLASAAYAEETPREPDLRSRPEFRLHEAEVKPIDREKVPGQVREKGKVLQIDGETLLKNPELLSRAMYSAVVSNNIAGIRVILPIYLQQAQQDKMLALYAQGILAQAEGRVKEAVSHYRELIAAQPDAPAVRMRLAAALFEDRQNEAAADQFDRLKTEDLPPQLMEQVELYRKALRERDAWKVNGGFSVTREHNINQAPKQQQYGNWTFPKQVDGTAVNYRFGAEKKWSLKNGWYTTAGGDVSGRVYPGNKKFNDMTAGVSGGIGFADRRKDVGLAVFHGTPHLRQRRLFLRQRRTPLFQPLANPEMANAVFGGVGAFEEYAPGAFRQYPFANFQFAGVLPECAPILDGRFGFLPRAQPRRPWRQFQPLRPALCLGAGMGRQRPVFAVPPRRGETAL